MLKVLNLDKIYVNTVSTPQSNVINGFRMPRHALFSIASSLHMFFQRESIELAESTVFEIARTYYYPITHEV